MSQQPYKCPHGRVYSMENICSICVDLGDKEIANASILGHLKEFFQDFFFFKFKYAMVDIVWFFQKLTNTGDFGPNGYYTKKGYWKDGRSTKQTEENNSPH